LRLKPIFDTNIFGHVQEGLITTSAWRYLLRHKPCRGRPLSNVTALELLVGLHDVPSAKFIQFRKQVELAWRLSNGRILEEPRFLLCAEVLGVPFPPELVPPSANVLFLHLDILRRAKMPRRDSRKPCALQGKGRRRVPNLGRQRLLATPKSHLEGASGSDGHA
jgi:hypothetical protein